MKREHKIELSKFAKEVAEGFSNRPNYKDVTFIVHRTIPTSESTANVTFFRRPDNKQVVGFFYRVNSNYKPWRYFIPTNAHILGMMQIKDLYYELEDYNFNVDI